MIWSTTLGPRYSGTLGILDVLTVVMTLPALKWFLAS